MEYIDEFDIRFLDRDTFYAGETLRGAVVLSTRDNFKLKGACVRVCVRACIIAVVVDGGGGGSSSQAR